MTDRQSARPVRAAAWEHPKCGRRQEWVMDSNRCESPAFAGHSLPRFHGGRPQRGSAPGMVGCEDGFASPFPLGTNIHRNGIPPVIYQLTKGTIYGGWGWALRCTTCTAAGGMPHMLSPLPCCIIGQCACNRHSRGRTYSRGSLARCFRERHGSRFGPQRALVERHCWRGRGVLGVSPLHPHSLPLQTLVTRR
jgi:hypothetical protein